MAKKKKKIEKTLKVQIPAGKAVPAPPLGPTLGQAGIPIGEFCSQFNEQTKEMGGDILPVTIIVFDDRSFEFSVNKPLVSALIKKQAGIQSGSGTNLTKKVGKLSKDQVRQIAEEKMEDLNTDNVEAAMKIVEGTAYSMGVEIKG